MHDPITPKEWRLKFRRSFSINALKNYKKHPQKKDYVGGEFPLGTKQSLELL